MRFNHMELTVAPETMTQRWRDDVDRFFCGVLGWRATDTEVPGIGPAHILLPDDGQFILLAEAKRHLDSPGWDHLGLLQDSRAEVDRILDECRRFATTDDRMRIQTFEADLVSGPVTTHAFYFRYLLPLWFDVQHLEYADGARPQRSWTYSREP